MFLWQRSLGLLGNFGETVPRRLCDGDHAQRRRRRDQLGRRLDLRRGDCLRRGLDDGGDHLEEAPVRLTSSTHWHNWRSSPCYP